ncbi:MAG: hypothetical protein ACLGHQ_13270, partial [Acidimicrobiia bacterium]
MPEKLSGALLRVRHVSVAGLYAAPSASAAKSGGTQSAPGGHTDRGSPPKTSTSAPVQTAIADDRGDSGLSATVRSPGFEPDDGSTFAVLDGTDDAGDSTVDVGVLSAIGTDDS